jgi:hypothetical protein
MIPALVDDCLYSVSFRPQELALYAEHVEISIRYQAIFEKDDEISQRHFKLLVVEFSAEIPADDGLAGPTSGRLELLKCGWELELSTSSPCLVGTLEELPEELPRLLSRIAETVNGLAERAKLEPPFTPELEASLLREHRSRSS